MFGDGPLTFQEFARREPHPLAVIHDAVLGFLRGRRDIVLCGGHAVNAYVNETRMTQDVDVLSVDSISFTAEIRRFLRGIFRIAVRLSVRGRLGFRIYQPRKRAKRNLVEVYAVKKLPPFQRIRRVQVIAPADLIANKIMDMLMRQNTPKYGLHRADLYRLLLTFPELKTAEGSVASRLRAAGASEEVFAAWQELVAQEILPEDEDEKFLRLWFSTLKGGIMKFTILLTPDAEDGGFAAECPQIPGCISEGDSVEEALVNIKEAITGCLESMAARQEPLPEEAPVIVATVDVEVPNMVSV